MSGENENCEKCKNYYLLINNTTNNYVQKLKGIEVY